jgi:hypothetical protein
MQYSFANYYMQLILKFQDLRPVRAPAGWPMGVIFWGGYENKWFLQNPPWRQVEFTSSCAAMVAEVPDFEILIGVLGPIQF